MAKLSLLDWEIMGSGPMARPLLFAAIAKGYGEQEMCTSIQVLEEFACVQVKVSAHQNKQVG